MMKQSQRKAHIKGGIECVDFVIINFKLKCYQSLP